ncbi:MAG: ATP-binding protein, partial [Nocardioides sp.]
PLGDALQQIADGAMAASLENETLDFKRDPHTVTGRGAPGNPQARLVEELVNAVVCFANARGGRVVLGIDDRSSGQPMILLLPQALNSVRATIDPEVAHVALAGGQEIALPDFSPIAVDEAVTNALVHRDYSRPECVVIDHSPNALRVWSPGGLPFGVTEDRLLSAVSTPRNATLMAAMQQLGLAERASRGIDRMFREQVRVGQRVPGIRTDEYSVEIYFTSGAPNRAFAGFVAGLPRALRENVDAMLSLVQLCQRPTLTRAEVAPLLQVSEVEARDRLDALAAGTNALVERDGDARRGVRWRLRPSVASALGTAVQHRARASSARPRVEAHLTEYGWITNRTIRNMFDLDVQQATQILNELRAANVVIKDPNGPQRGPSIRWLPVKPSKGR